MTQAYDGKDHAGDTQPEALVTHTNIIPKVGLNFIKNPVEKDIASRLVPQSTTTNTKPQGAAVSSPPAMVLWRVGSRPRI